MKEIKRTTKTATFTFHLRDGRACHLRAIYVTRTGNKTAWADEEIILDEIITDHSGSEVEVFVGGELVDNCQSDLYTHIYKDEIKGTMVWRVAGTKVAMVKEEDVERYKAFIAELTAPEDKQPASNSPNMIAIAAAQIVVAAYERGFAAQDAREAANKARAYRRNILEGGEGYCPVWYTQAQYDAARAVLAKI